MIEAGADDIGGLAGGKFPRKIRIESPFVTRQHRSGWGFAMGALAALHDSRGIYLDDFIERSFLWNASSQRKWLPHCVQRRLKQLRGRTDHPFAPPYDFPWIGFVHNPPRVPSGLFDKPRGLATILAQETWQRSLSNCLGLFTLSDYLRCAIEPFVVVPVVNLLHPTELPTQYFTMEAYREAPRPTLVQVGWFLRRIASIYALHAPGHTKIHLLVDQPHMRRQLAHELETRRLSVGDTMQVRFLSNDTFDELLARSVVFLDLYDASANNAVIECIVRHTPILVNRLPATEEYLGKNYPLFFTDLQEAAQLAQDIGAIRAAHESLRDSPIRPKLSGEYFARSFADSEIYRALPELS